MDIYYGNTQLASSGVDGPSGLRINGEAVVDDVPFFRGSALTYYGRGNKSTRVQFSRWWYFGSLKAAEVHCARHLAELSVQADLLLVAGNPGDEQDLVLADAVLENLTHEQRGQSVLTTYQFAGGLFTTEEVTLPDESEIVKTGVIDLEIGDASKVVTFAVAFGAAPNFCNAVVTVPTDEAGIRASPVEGTITAAGFTAKLSAAVTVEGCKLRYFAAL